MLTHTHTHTQQLYLDVPVREQQVDDDVDWEALHVVQTLLDSTQLGCQLHASVQLSSFSYLVQDGLPEILAGRQKKTRVRNNQVYYWI